VEQLLPLVNIADHTVLHCTQINSFESGNSTRKHFDGNHFMFSQRSRMRST